MMYIPVRVLRRLEVDHPEAVEDLKFHTLLAAAARLERKGRGRTRSETRRLNKIKQALGGTKCVCVSV